jgi:hypothetical protein
MVTLSLITDDGGLTDDDTGCVVQEDALADGGGQVDVDGEDLDDPLTRARA